MDEKEIKCERRKQRALERLGTNNPSCAGCGETDWRCMELHHIAGKDLDEITAIYCRNCHRKLSDEQKNHPEKIMEVSDFSEQLGHFLLGLADMLALIVPKLREFANSLLENMCEFSGEATENDR